MKGAKYILTAAVIAMSSVMMTGCFKPSKDAVVESKYYQSLKDERDKLSVQLKENTEKMKEENAKVWKEIYEDFYKIPLEYTTIKEDKETVNE